jgi:hypothetical protein
MSEEIEFARLESDVSAHLRKFRADLLISILKEARIIALCSEVYENFERAGLKRANADQAALTLIAQQRAQIFESASGLALEFRST